MKETLIPLILLFLCSAVTAYGGTYVVRGAAVRAGLLDRPGDERRIHETDTPRLGGLAIIFGFRFPLLLVAALGGSRVGLYRWNMPPAKIFMGDTGSMFIGMLLAAVSIARPSKAPVVMAIGGPMLALALPVLDTLIVMKQRFSGRKVPLLG